MSVFCETVIVGDTDLSSSFSSFWMCIICTQVIYCWMVSLIKNVINQLLVTWEIGDLKNWNEKKKKNLTYFLRSFSFPVNPRPIDLSTIFPPLHLWLVPLSSIIFVPPVYSSTVAASLCAIVSIQVAASPLLLFVSKGKNLFIIQWRVLFPSS